MALAVKSGFVSVGSKKETEKTGISEGAGHHSIGGNINSERDESILIRSFTRRSRGL